MRILLGAIFLSLAVFLYCFVLLGCRNPKPAWWASDAWVSNVHCIAIIGLALCGVMLFAFGLPILLSGGVGIGYIFGTIAIFLATGFGVKKLKMKERIAALAAAKLSN